MKLEPSILLPAALAALSALAPAQNVGDRLRDTKKFKEIKGYSGTKARSIGDFAGRALLLEFFAYW